MRHGNISKKFSNPWTTYREFRVEYFFRIGNLFLLYDTQGTYQTVSHLSTASENGGMLDTTLSTLNGSACQSYPEPQSQVTRDQSQAQAAESNRSKTPSSLTLYTYLLDSNKTSKEVIEFKI